jgi:hypothetical protein
LKKEDYLLIKQLIKDEIAKANFNKLYTAKVISVSGDFVDINITGSTTLISNVKNKTGEVLSTNDDIYIEAINNNFNNIVAKYKIT